MKSKTEPRHIAGLAGVVACLLLAQLIGGPVAGITLSGLALAGALLAFDPARSKPAGA